MSQPAQFNHPHGLHQQQPQQQQPRSAMPSHEHSPQMSRAATPAFEDRFDAGRQLAQRLRAYAGQDDVTVLGLPRGGVPVAYEVAQALQAPLDLLVVRKLGLPGQPEYAVGAIASGGVKVLNTEVIRRLGLRPSDLESVTRAELRELHRRERLYRGERALPALAGRRIILVDDGLATGASMRAAVLALKEHRPHRIVVAVPVGSPEACALLRQEADEVVCDLMPERFNAVGQWYRDFPQTQDSLVRDLMGRSASVPPLGQDRSQDPARDAPQGAAAQQDGPSAPVLDDEEKLQERARAPESIFGALP